MARKISKSRKRRLLIMGTASIIAFAFFCVNLFNYTYKIVVLSKEQSKLVKELDYLKEQKEILDNEITKLQDNEYLAKYAREKYLYTKDNEMVIKVHDRDAFASKIEEDEKLLEETNRILMSRRIIVGVSLVGLVTLVIIARKKS